MNIIFVYENFNQNFCFQVLTTVYDDENEENMENHEEEDDGGGESDEYEEEEEEECDVWFKNSKNCSNNSNNNCTKIELKVISKHSATNSTSSSSISSDLVEPSFHDRSKNTPSSLKEENSSLNFHQKIISTSSPDLFSISCENNHIKINQKCLTTINDYNNGNFVVSSVPDCLNLCGTNGNLSVAHHNTSYTAFDSVANKDFNLYDFQPQNQKQQQKKTVTFHQHIDQQQQQQTKKPQNLRASYANLTILDYSDDEDDINQYYMSKMGHNNQNQQSNAFGSLLDEITAHFDRNLSIINDQCAEYEPIAAFLNEQRGYKLPPPISVTPPATSSSSSSKTNKLKPPSHPPPQPPLPPPRIRTQIKTNPHQSAGQVSKTVVPQVTINDVKPTKPTKKTTFDQDPTNLVTCYAESLERCNFDLSDSSQFLYKNTSGSDLNVNEPTIRHYSTPIKRDFIASTPNLNYYHHYDDDHFVDCDEDNYRSEKETKSYSTSMKNLRNTGKFEMGMKLCGQM